MTHVCSFLHLLGAHLRVHWLAYIMAAACAFMFAENYRIGINQTDSLPQSLFLIKIRGDVEPDPFQIALLVGELPAIYMPGTDPIERLDQLAAMAEQTVLEGDTGERRGQLAQIA